MHAWKVFDCDNEYLFHHDMHPKQLYVLSPQNLRGDVDDQDHDEYDDGCDDDVQVVLPNVL